MADASRTAETFTRRVMILAAIYGFLAVPLLYFTDAPDPHRLLYFAFAGIALVFQGVFLVIASDPRRFQPLLPLCVFEKLSFGIPALAFWSRGQAANDMGLGGAADLLLGALFLACWWRMQGSA